MIDDRREKVRLYGRLLIDFANAETSDEAGLTYIENMKRAFGFSGKAKEFIEDRDIPREFAGFPILGDSKLKFNDDDEQLKKTKASVKKSKGPIEITQCKIPLENDSAGEDSIRIGQMVIEEHAHIHSLKKDLYASLKKINDARGPARHSYKTDEDYYKAVRLPLFSKHEDKEPDQGSGALQYFLSRYQKIRAPFTFLTLGDHGRITAKHFPVFDADYYLNRYDRYSADFLTAYYDSPISYCLIEFLRDTEAVLRLRICPYCKKFFMAKDKKRIRCYDYKCRRDSEREKKRRQRSEDPVRYL